MQRQQPFNLVVWIKPQKRLHIKWSSKWRRKKKTTTCKSCELSSIINAIEMIYELILKYCIDSAESRLLVNSYLEQATDRCVHVGSHFSQLSITLRLSFQTRL